MSSEVLGVKPSTKLLTSALSIAVLSAAGTFGSPVSIASASGPVAVSSSTHSKRARHPREGACTARRHTARGCKASVRRAKIHGRAKPHASTHRTKAQAAAEATAQSASEQSAAIAAALSAPCANTELTPAEGNIPLIRAAVLCLVNRERAQNGVAPLRYNEALEAAAENHCSELIADDYFAHISPSGETPVDRIRGFGYIPGPSAGYVIGENLAWGTYTLSTAQSIVSAWIASPGHLANILESEYTETGIGVIPAVPASLADGAPGATYAQEFGVIIE
jgi:uncharacterized protein YkwD